MLKRCGLRNVLCVSLMCNIVMHLNTPIQFWSLIKKIFLESLNTSYQQGQLSETQKQGIITLLDKGKDRTLLKNWRPISLLNTDYKIASKAIAQRLKLHIPSLIHHNQVGYVKGRCITENIRTLADLICFIQKI